MNVTMKPEIKTRRKDGTWPVYIRVTFKRKSRHIPTTLVCTASDLTRSGRIKSQSVLEAADDLVRRMRDTLRDVSFFQLETWDVERVVATIRDGIAGEQFALDFFAWADGFLDCKTPSNRRTYDQALGALERYLGRRTIDVNEITRAMLLDFVDFVNAEPKMHTGRPGEWTETTRAKRPGAAAALHIRKLGHIFRAAKDRYNDEDAGRIVIPRSPFDTIRVQVAPSTGGQRSIGREAMQRVILAETASEKERIALDAFVVSFGLMGANLADLWAAREFDGDTWEYQRQKTRNRRVDGALMRVTVQDPIRPFIARLRARGEQTADLWLPALRTMGTTKDICTEKVNAHLRAWARREGLPDFTFYAARHTWATLARREGIEKATVDECLGHVGDFAVTDIYAERSWDVINAANAKVLALFDWPTTG